MSNEILAITITFNPEIERLETQIRQLDSSGVDILIVDNGSDNSAEISGLLQQETVTVNLRLIGSNVGIATAQNHGIEYAREQGYRYVLLMDQDSIPSDNMVDILYQALRQHDDAAAVGPVFIDSNGTKHSRFIRVEGLRVNKNLEADSTGCVDVDHLIASGSLIPVDVFEKIGGMDDSLFIDYVDVEWSLRARHQGLRCYGVLNAAMTHSLGERRVAAFNRSVAIHAPVRHYYQVRNAILLYKRNYIPVNWKVLDAYKLVAKLAVFILSAENKSSEIKMISKGFLDAFRNISGKYK
ncbi:glycosyltransferase family 2 protein [Klebsiella quasipneumoniae]|uniref:glycosyltransferase family 2 protein n=1 Tax=Klebsiella pneumoniae complex TaxID=3390273 RepID=UPI00164586F1|nr:glycosyltransferase family 2 protein [Klebsiella quasipneumoniae]HBR1128690.1 glycosyltransferase family 2 protein [Klebsiella quasipneumoniae subsp. similipneumoniae]HBR1670605.1 glycosyltransferase family 2 protein [Klebsiella quasipneumoniae subsp. quasipneumoniae]HBR2224287.1 glycosyltransferase family 2 protein [Klebsiella pneumoniae]MBC4285496.1 glycosyltransferase family 2 protein [Klebsiella quasipneumoniae]MDR4840458.1 glycosyltransferase family 2 protein [Klebsiella quasipneumonia